MSDETWGNLPIPNIYIELEGNFVEFNEHEESLTCDFPVLSKFFLYYPTLYDHLFL